VLPFEGMFVNFRRTGLSPESFVTIEAGETITTSVNAAKTYKLAGLAKAQISVIQGFKYVTGSVAPTTLKEMATCDFVSSNTVTVTPDQSTVAE
jgi:deuterolysin